MGVANNYFISREFCLKYYESYFKSLSSISNYDKSDSRSIKYWLGSKSELIRFGKPAELSTFSDTSGNYEFGKISDFLRSIDDS